MVVLGIDLGTTGAKAVLVAPDGRVVARGYCAYPSRTGDGAHEQDPADWWTAVRSAVRSARADASTEVVGIGLSGHMHALVLVDAAGVAVRPAMTWADRRCSAEVRELAEAGVFEKRCANPVVEAFTAPKLRWLSRVEPSAMQRARRLVLPKDLLRHQLTGTWGTDQTDACGTMLFDVARQEWDDELWQLAGGDSAWAPTVSQSSAVVGTLTDAAAAELLLTPGVPVVAGAGDVACAALGAGVVRPGQLYLNAGTAAQILAPTVQPAMGGFFNFGRADAPGFLAGSSVYAAGLSVQWAARTWLAGAASGSSDAPGGAGAGAAGAAGTAGDAGAAGAAGAGAAGGGPGALVERIAAGCEPGSAGLSFVPHLLGMSAPTHQAAVRGGLVGLGVEHDSAAVARAVLEGTAFACASAMEDLAGIVGAPQEIRVGGGMTASEIWLSTVAATQTVPVLRVADDASPLGAAMLAGIGVGQWPDAAAAAAACVQVALVAPVPDRGAVGEALVRYRDAEDVLRSLAGRSSNE